MKNIEKALKKGKFEKLKDLINKLSNDDYQLKYYLTNFKAKQFEEGELPKSKAVEIATKRAVIQYKKQLEKDLEKIKEIEQSEDIKAIRVAIDWTKNGNAYSECWAGGKYTKGRACGYGYDKESSAIAECFNSNPSILKIIYKMKEKALAKDKTITSHNSIGYGAGYGILPYFEGGVGTSCFVHILEKAGFTHVYMEGKSFTGYIFRREKK